MLRKPEALQQELEWVSIWALVPERHLRKIDAAVDFSFNRDRVKHLYCAESGRPALDPVLTTNRQGYRQYHSEPDKCRECLVRERRTHSRKCRQLVKRHVCEASRDRHSTSQHRLNPPTVRTPLPSFRGAEARAAALPGADRAEHQENCPDKQERTQYAVGSLTALLAAFIVWLYQQIAAG